MATRDDAARLISLIDAAGDIDATADDYVQRRDGALDELAALLTKITQQPS